MKKIVSFISVFLCCSFIVCSTTVFAQTSSNTSNISAQKEASHKYVLSCFEDIIASQMDNDMFLSRINDINMLVLGVPYIVYHNEHTIQNNVMYYPIIDSSTNQVVYLIETIGIDGRYICNPLDHMVDVLNEIDYINNDSVAYYLNNSVYFETESAKIDSTYFYNNDYNMKNYSIMLSESESEFINSTFEEKKSIISQNTTTLMDFSNYIITDADSVLSMKCYGYLNLNNPQGQYDYDMCWASAVATVNNYLNSTVTNGFEVCTRMGKGYNDGGNAYEIQDALWKYGIDYGYVRADALTWQQLKNNIDSDYPPIANGSNTAYTNGHTVTISGYKPNSQSSTAYNVRIWNSALNGGTGGYSDISYGDPFYTEGGGIPYYWSATISYQ